MGQVEYAKVPPFTDHVVFQIGEMYFGLVELLERWKACQILEKMCWHFVLSADTDNFQIVKEEDVNHEPVLRVKNVGLLIMEIVRYCEQQLEQQAIKEFNNS